MYSKFVLGTMTALVMISGAEAQPTCADINGNLGNIAFNCQGNVLKPNSENINCFDDPCGTNANQYNACCSITGKCTGNTDSITDINCSSGDGTNPANTKNKGSTVSGNSVSACCEAQAPGPGKDGTCGDIDGDISGATDSFVCGAEFSLRGSPGSIACGATPCLTNSDATQKGACCVAQAGPGACASQHAPL